MKAESAQGPDLKKSTRLIKGQTEKCALGAHIASLGQHFSTGGTYRGLSGWRGVGKKVGIEEENVRSAVLMCGQIQWHS